MSPRQQRKALQEVALTNTTAKLEALNALIQLAESQSDVQFSTAIGRGSDGRAEITDQDLAERAQANKLALHRWLGEPIAGADGQAIKITEEIADFINSVIGFRIRANEMTPDPGVSVGDNLTRGHVMAIFGTKHAYMTPPGGDGWPTVGGLTQAHLGTPSAPPAPIWALPGLVHTQRPAAYGGQGISPLSGRALVEITQVHTVNPAVDDLESGLDLEEIDYPIGYSVALRGDALGTMLQNGTPEIQTFGIAHHLSAQPLQYEDPETGEILTSGPTLVPALSAESVATLVDGLARVVGQIPEDHLDLGDADPAGVQLGERLSEIAIDAPSRITGSNGEDLLPFIGSDPSEDEVTSQLQDEVEGTMMHIIRSVPSLGQQQAEALEGVSPEHRIEGDPREVMPPMMQEMVESMMGDPQDVLSTLLELSIGSNMFYFNELDDEERDAMFDLIDNLTFEGELTPLDPTGLPDREAAQLARDTEIFQGILDASGMRGEGGGPSPRRRKVAWTSYMGMKDSDNLPPWMRPTGHEAATFLSELMTAHLMGGEIRAEITEFQMGVLRKLTKWLKENQEFTAKVNLWDPDEELWDM